MTDGSDGLDDEVAGWLAADFDLRIDDVALVEGGIDREARLWRVRDAAGRDLAVKWTSGGSSASLELTRALVDAGVEGIAAPLLSTHGRLFSERGGRRLVVLPWIDLPVALNTELREAHWVALGRLLAAVHATPVAALPTLPPSDQQHGRLRGAVIALHRDLDRLLDPRAATDVPDDVIGPLLAEAPLLREVVDTLMAGADHLHAAGLWSGRSEPSVACHADPHLGNVLAGDDGEVLLLDFDDAVIGPREQDLLFVLDGGVLAFAPVTSEQTEAFFTGYGPVELDAGALAYHRSIRALEDLVDFALEVLAPDRHERSLRKAASGYLRGNLLAGGLTEAALRSLKEVGAVGSIPALTRS